MNTSPVAQVKITEGDRFISYLDFARTLNPSASDLARTLNLASDLAHASIHIFNLERTEAGFSASVFDHSLFLDLLSICISFSAYELFIVVSNNNHQTFRKRIFVSHNKKETIISEIQEVLNQGVEINQRLERLKKRRQGEEPACGGILIIKERKQEV